MTKKGRPIKARKDPKNIMMRLAFTDETQKQRVLNKIHAAMDKYNCGIGKAVSYIISGE